VDAELFAIINFCLAIAKATATGCPCIVVITDCLPAAKRAVDTTIHSSQGHSIAISILISSLLDLPGRQPSFLELPMPVGPYTLRSITKPLGRDTQLRNKCKHDMIY